MALFDDVDFDGHEQVVFCSDAFSGLRAIIAIHSSKRGPALGGCRMLAYETTDNALTDVLRFSRGMTYQSAMAGLELGGGRSVIIGDPQKHKTSALFRAMGQAVERLGGRYIIAEDVGTTVHDMNKIRLETRHVVGVGTELGGSGDPSPTTALGCEVGIKAAVAHNWKTRDLRDARVAVQGLGHVGWHLCEYLKAAGAHLIVSDIHKSRTERAEREFRATAIEPDRIYDVEADVFAPCALGAILNDATIPRLKMKVIAGAADNQLAGPVHGDVLVNRGILYAPDYIVNAAGLIRADSERRGFDREWVARKVSGIADTLAEVFEISQSLGISTVAAADRLAQQKIAATPFELT
jgi:leucine dehydrogenase